jgi:hypothetical protein
MRRVAVFNKDNVIVFVTFITLYTMYTHQYVRWVSMEHQKNKISESESE